ncbi:acyl-CoA dehydrogenase [Desertihabitans brevis]|uniref:Broad-specificity linear acyl-CoA dehydrogenase FadE5 n=1 Tax=Desertihabitans brevis TaxID=2268447 RepID=A0A367YY79_9ACTN|nr:acyl-CoA dehydrogenase [Desertihabitans brevis]RCK69972.1 acyl-CoA dehydrogenase [Desertihabitans brevis]
MSHYKPHLRDITFTLFEVLGREQVLGTGPAADLDRETAEAMLTEVAALATDKLAAAFVEGDRNPPEFDPATSTVTLPESMHLAFKSWMDSEWWRVELPGELDGQDCPPSLRWAVLEQVLGANPALYMYAAGPKFAQVLWTNGTERDRRIAQHMVRRQWGATMALTEPDAGSDVGAGRTRALPQPDGSWHLEGVKRFITSGEHDLTENIVHLVLARPVGVEGAGGPGTKGLSLFLVPKHHFDLETGELTGVRNGVYATNVEKKMGIKVSATCELTFGEREPAVGWLLGEVHQGIRQMFQVIEHARMMVGTKAIATLSTGYLNALEYARSRVQGPDLTQAADKTAPRVRITSHPDVRRSLMTQKMWAEALRALVLYTASVQDDVWLSEAAGERDELAARVNDLLLPLVKGYGSERSWVVLGTESLQTLGGSGFLSDYPLEQYVRDAKIDTLYEGTTAIQGQDLFFRKIVRDQGQALGWLSAQIGAFAEADGPLAEERALLQRALHDAGAIVGLMVQHLQSADPRTPGGDPRDVYKVGLTTTRALMALGDVVCAWLLLRGAEVAIRALEAGPDAADRDFYTGKVASARWFVRTVLPHLTAERTIAEGTTLELMDLPESAF